MPRELKPGFVPIPINIPPTSESEVKESAPIPSTLKEFQEATTNALDFGDKHLGLWSADGTELSTIAFEEWTNVSMELDEMFFELRDGILGKQLLTFASMADAELVNPHIRSEIEAILAQTAPFARRMNPLVDRLCVVNPTMSREEVIGTLREGELNATETLDYIAKQPVRRSLLGIFHDLEERIGRIAVEEKKEILKGSRLWSFENPTINDLTPVVILSDPFATDTASQEYWKDRANEPILKRSQQKTQSIIYELEGLRQTMVGNGEKKKVMDALDVIESWLESNMILYRDGKEVDFELYHLGMEDPSEVDAIFGSLDIIKHDNPEFFVQLMGINPEGGKSPYFGSFIHKALFNTQKTLEGIITEAPNLVLKSSMKQLLRIDGTVQRWNFNETISEESLKALAQKRQEQEDQAKTPEEKAQIRLFWQAILTKPTIEVAVKRQLEAMKEVNFKELKTELLAKLDDHEHPMLALKAISTLPLVAFRDGAIKRRLTEIFGDEFMKHPDILRKHCAEEHPEMVRLIFNQIPIFDYENAKMGNFISIALQETMNREGRLKKMLRQLRSDVDLEERIFFKNIFKHRAITTEMILKNIKNDEERKFVQDLDVEMEISTISLQGIPPHDRPFYNALWNVKNNGISLLYANFHRGTEQAEVDFDDRKRVYIAQATLENGKGAKILLKGFDQFRLRKPDAAKVVKVMFEHLPNLTSYEKFEFLLKHAEKFEEGECYTILMTIPQTNDLWRDVIRFAKEGYPPAFLRYFHAMTHSNEYHEPWMTKEGKIFETLVDELLNENIYDRGNLWDEERIVNFAKTPWFNEIFVKFAQKAFQKYPNLPEKLYGEWGARMVRKLRLEKEPRFLKILTDVFPKDANDHVGERYRKLRSMFGDVVDGKFIEWKFVEGRDILRGIVAAFEKEFPEATSPEYAEMREVFGERMLGFAEVERAFTTGERRLVEIGEGERKYAIKWLEEKLGEPDVEEFLKYLMEHEEERKMWALVYRKKESEEHWRSIFKRLCISEGDEEILGKDFGSWSDWEKHGTHLPYGWFFLRENKDKGGRFLSLHYQFNQGRLKNFLQERGLDEKKVWIDGDKGLRFFYDELVLKRGTQQPNPKKESSGFIVGLER